MLLSLKKKSFNFFSKTRRVVLSPLSTLDTDHHQSTVSRIVSEPESAAEGRENEHTVDI